MNISIEHGKKSTYKIISRQMGAAIVHKVKGMPGVVICDTEAPQVKVKRRFKAQGDPDMKISTTNHHNPLQALQWLVEIHERYGQATA